MYTFHSLKKYKRAKKELEAYGFKQNSFVSKFPLIFLGFILLLSTSVEIISRLITDFQMLHGISSFIIASGFLGLGFHQWRAARHEISLDKFYDRLDMADKRLENWPAARRMLNHFWENTEDQATYECLNYVYVELDNLEYGVEKYRMGYMNAEIALRCLKTFESRCMSRQFRESASKYVREFGYQPTTVEVVQRVCRDVQKKSEAKSDREQSRSSPI